MLLNKKSYSVLKSIYKNPYISHKKLKESRKFSKYTDYDFNQIVYILEINKLISFRVHDCYEKDDGTEQIGINDVNHLITLPDGDIIIENHRREFLCFIVPYSITTAIALASLLREIPIMHLLQAIFEVLNP